MTIRYSISWFDSAQAMQAREHKVLFRSDSAKRAIYTMARNMVESWAGLDTKWGWQFMRDVMAEPIIPLPIGHMRHFCQRLPRGDELHVYVERLP